MAKAEDLEDNDYIVFKKMGELETAAAVKLTGGTNGEDVTVADYQEYLSLIEPYYFNTLGYAGSDNKVQALMMAFVKRMRDDEGVKFQVVLYGAEKPDFEGVINVNKANKVTDKGAELGSVVYWLTGAEASCPINQDLTNTRYNGEFNLACKLKQHELIQASGTGC